MDDSQKLSEFYYIKKRGQTMLHPQFLNEEILNQVFDSAYSGTIIVDNNGKIQYISENYCEFLNVEQEQMVGEYVVNVIENTRMHIVVQTGQPEIADLQLLNGTYVVANRIPLFENRKIIGAIGTIVFKDLDHWKVINEQIKEKLLKRKFYEKGSSSKHGTTYHLNDLVGNSTEIKELKERVKRIARGTISVLIRGESGTGKEIVAHSIHHLSERSEKPFIKVNCGAIPEHLLESELFGYEEGAFTGAKKGGKPGKFQLADGGTIFLDEIGDMPLYMQVKLLRVLQEKEIEPVGALYPKKIDVRLIAATNHSLEKLIDEKKFRKDLFYRINSIQLFIPPLRKRPQDLSLLISHILNKTSAKLGKRVHSIDLDALSILEQYRWPGNIRELENAINASVHLTNDEVITKEDLPEYLIATDSVEHKAQTLKNIIEEAEKKAIEKTLKKYHYNKHQAAKELGIGNSTLYDKIKKYKINDQMKMVPEI